MTNSVEGLGKFGDRVIPKNELAECNPINPSHWGRSQVAPLIRSLVISAIQSQAAGSLSQATCPGTMALLMASVFKYHSSPKTSLIQG